MLSTKQLQRILKHSWLPWRTKRISLSEKNHAELRNEIKILSLGQQIKVYLYVLILSKKPRKANRLQNNHTDFKVNIGTPFFIILTE